MLYIFGGEVGWLSFEQLRLSIYFSGPRIFIGQFDLSFFRKEHIFWSDIAESALLAVDEGEFFFGCADGIEEVPKFGFWEAGPFISEKFDGIVEYEWIIIVSDLDI